MAGGRVEGLRDGSGRLLYVGFYGCSNADRVVKVAPPTEDDRPHHLESWKVDCPCGYKHVVRPMWRPAKDRADLESAEYKLPLLTVRGEEMVAAKRGVGVGARVSPSASTRGA